MRTLIVGAGFSGAVIGRALAEAGHEVTVIDKRPHVAGNCHTTRDPDTGVMVHVYGPHIFHTDDDEVWSYVTGFGAFEPYRNQVKSRVGNRVFQLPINLHTINQFFDAAMTPDEARAFVADLADTSITDPQNFEEQALSMVGPALYHAFFKGYTEKQWGCAPTELPAAILKRLPLRFTYDDNYFFHRHQGIPREGYSAIVARILDVEGLSLRLDTPYRPEMRADYDHIVWSGPIDEFFEFELGRLGYRTLDFERFTYDGSYQGCAVMNYPDAEVPFTRITEHKYFAPHESHERSTCYREYSRAAEPGDTPYYPIRLVAEQRMLKAYTERAAELTGVTFVGRLGTYRYLDMDVTIREALDTAAALLHSACKDERPPIFLAPPV